MGPVPTSIKVVSILGIIYAGLGLVSTPCAFVMMFHPLTPNPALDTLNQDAGYVAITLMSLGIHLILSLLLLYGSISSLKLKPAGRTTMIAYAWALIATTIINNIFAFIYVLPKMNAVMSDPALPPGTATVAKVSGIVGQCFGLLLVGAIAGVILYFFNRTVAVNAFKGIFPAQSSNFPVEYPTNNPQV